MRGLGTSVGGGFDQINTQYLIWVELSDSDLGFFSVSRTEQAETTCCSICWRENVTWNQSQEEGLGIVSLFHNFKLPGIICFPDEMSVVMCNWRHSFWRNCASHNWQILQDSAVTNETVRRQHQVLRSLSRTFSDAHFRFVRHLKQSVVWPEHHFSSPHEPSKDQS